MSRRKTPGEKLWEAGRADCGSDRKWNALSRPVQTFLNMVALVPEADRLEIGNFFGELLGLCVEEKRPPRDERVS